MTKTVSAPFVAFITDFGLVDGYVFEMHAVLLSICPEAYILDISHDISPGDIRSAAYLVGRAATRLPHSSIFVAVVDPGVGSERQAVLIKCFDSFFIGPDNGIFSRVINRQTSCEVRLLDWQDTGLSGRSSTFHGRDLFTPVAARLAAGCNFSEIGKPGILKDTFPAEEPRRCENGWIGEIVYVDRFGNLITNLPNELTGRMEVGGKGDIEFTDHYRGQARVNIFWLHGSDGNIEIARNCGSAAEALDVGIGSIVKLFEC